MSALDPACLREAREFDREGVAIGKEFAAIDREGAEGMFLQNRINVELPLLGDYDKAASNDFQRRVICHEELAKKFQAEFQRYQQKQKAYDAAVTALDRDRALCFAAGDLAVKAARHQVNSRAFP